MPMYNKFILTHDQNHENILCAMDEFTQYCQRGHFTETVKTISIKLKHKKTSYSYRTNARE